MDKKTIIAFVITLLVIFTTIVFLLIIQSKGHSDYNDDSRKPYDKDRKSYDKDKYKKSYDKDKKSVKNCDLKCDKYRYGSCPAGCVEKCVSTLGYTEDCAGVGSCSCP